MPFSQIIELFCTGFLDLMYTGVLDIGSLPFGCYSNIEDETGYLVGTASILAALITAEDA